MIYIITIVKYQMDKLSISLLALSFIFGGSGITSAFLVTMLCSGSATFNYATLFGLTTFLTHYFYGFFTTIYIMLSSLALIGSGTMYWLDLSVDDVKHKVSVFDQQLIDETQPDPEGSENSKDTKGSENSENLNPLNQKIKKIFDVSNSYKNISIDVLQKRLKVTPEKIIIAKRRYAYVSLKFDTVCRVLYKYLCRFQEATKNVPGLKLLYGIYQQIYSFIKNIETIRNLHKISRNMDQMEQMEQMDQMNQMNQMDGMDKMEYNVNMNTGVWVGPAPIDSSTNQEKISLDSYMNMDTTLEMMQKLKDLEKMFANMSSLVPKQNLSSDPILNSELINMDQFQGLGTNLMIDSGKPPKKKKNNGQQNRQQNY